MTAKEDYRAHQRAVSNLRRFTSATRWLTSDEAESLLEIAIDIANHPCPIPLQNVPKNKRGRAWIYVAMDDSIPHSTYIGSTINPAQRMKSHCDDDAIWFKETTSMVWFDVAEESRFVYEYYYIKMMQPKYNKVGNR